MRTRAADRRGIYGCSALFWVHRTPDRVAGSPGGLTGGLPGSARQHRRHWPGGVAWV